MTGSRLTMMALAAGAAGAITLPAATLASPRPLDRAPSAQWIGSQVPTLPPPAPGKLAPYFPRFWFLLTSYHHLSVDKKPTFAQWLVINGVTDPAAFSAMMQLYAWYIAGSPPGK